MQITAAVKHADRDTFSIERLELEPPRANEILVKIAASVCAIRISCSQVAPTAIPFRRCSAMRDPASFSPWATR